MKNKEIKEPVIEKQSFWKSNSSTIYSIFLLAPPIAIIFFYYYMDYLISYYMNFSMNDYNFYSNFNRNASYSLLILFCFSLFLLFQNILENKKPTKIEKKLQSFLNKIQIIEVNTFFYSTFVILISSILYYIIIQTIIFYALGSSLIYEYDHHTFEKLEYYGYAIDYISFGLIIGCFIFYHILKIKDKIKCNRDILFGAFVLPILINCIEMIDIKSFHFNMDFINNGLSYFLNMESYQYFDFVQYFISLSIVFIIYSAILCIKKDKFTILKKLKHSIAGFFIGIIFFNIACYLAINSKEAKLFRSDANSETVMIEGINYNYKNSLLTHDDFKNDPMGEYLVEGYDGHSLHNSSTYFNYLFSNSYTGNKEKAFKLYSKVYLKNSINIENTKELRIKALKEGINLQEGVNLLIGLKIYEVSPLHQYKDFYEKILKGQYQLAIDSYITNILNYNNVKESIGIAPFTTLVSSIVQNGYAKIDYSKINNAIVAEKLKKEIDEEIYEGTASTNEQIENWYKIFNI